MGTGTKMKFAIFIEIKNLLKPIRSLVDWGSVSWWKDLASLEEAVDTNWFKGEVMKKVGNGGRTNFGRIVGYVIFPL